VIAGRSKFSFSDRGPGSRLLSYALLFLFVFSSTAEAVHHHGVARNVLAAATTTEADSGALSTSSNPSTPQRSSPTSECLVCQFQQNLSSAEIFTPLLVLAPVTSDQRFHITAAIFRSATTSTPQGRGPPPIS